MNIALNENAYSVLKELSAAISKDLVKAYVVSTPSNKGAHDFDNVEKDGIVINPDYSRGFGGVDAQTNSLVGLDYKEFSIGIHLWDKETDEDGKPKDGANLFIKFRLPQDNKKSTGFFIEINNTNNKGVHWTRYNKEYGSNKMLDKAKSTSKKLYDMAMKAIDIMTDHVNNQLN